VFYFWLTVSQKLRKLETDLYIVLLGGSRPRNVIKRFWFILLYEILLFVSMATHLKDLEKSGISRWLGKRQVKWKSQGELKKRKMQIYTLGSFALCGLCFTFKRHFLLSAFASQSMNLCLPCFKSQGILFDLENGRLVFRVMLCMHHLQGVDVQALLDDVRKLKIIAKGHERRIKYLEDRLAAYEDVATSMDDQIDEQME